jgi:hypothetical protein
MQQTTVATAPKAASACMRATVRQLPACGGGRTLAGRRRARIRRDRWTESVLEPPSHELSSL